MSTAPRRTLAGLLAGLLAGAAALLGLAGCGRLDEASAADITRDDPVSALAAQLAGGSTLSYTATYQVAGGDTATITRAQRPARTAYVYPGGRLIVTTTGTIRCQGDKAPTCVETAPDAAAATNLPRASLITPEAVLELLTAAALDPDPTTTQHDTTIAGRHASCLALSNVEGTEVPTFDVCVTNEGALASFTATIDGKRSEVALTAYSDRVTGEAFTLPAAAKVTDKRPRQ